MSSAFPPPPLGADSFLCLGGPTAVGKSEIALSFAERVGGEIISVDSMQVYRGLDIGTGKPSAAERARVRHHLIDVAELTESFDAARFVRLARQAVSDIQARGRVPILCGGTGLYFKAFLVGLGEAPPADPALRQTLERTPLSELLRELEVRDPATAGRIDHQNPRRVIRAVEVIRLTGKPFSTQRAAWGPEAAPGDSGSSAPFFCLSRPLADLRQRIEQRVEHMFARGLVAETDALLGRGLAENLTALQALGYRQVVEHLQGARSLPETITLVKTRTQQFAKRQLTWFRRQFAAQWLELGSGAATVDAALAQMEHALGRGEDSAR